LPVEDKKVVNQFSDQADEIMMKNIASIVGKRGWFEACFKILKEEGGLVLVDTYTGGGLWEKEHEEALKMLENIGFEAEDFTQAFNDKTKEFTDPIKDHPLVERALSLGFTDKVKVLLRLKKPSQSGGRNKTG
jgi:hypothetical protein